jgi:conjugal transfer pilus assembly protein TraU
VSNARTGRVAALTATLLLSSVAQALPTSGRDFQCPDANVFGATLITGICWSCMFPVYLAGVEMFDGRSGRPAGANEDRVCFCEGDWDTGQMPTVGFSVGMFMPSRIIESVRKPWCFPTLFGADMADATVMDGALAMGGAGKADAKKRAQAYGQFTWHFYAFPLLEILELVDLPQCNVDNYSTFDVMFMSEAFPNWYDEELGFLIHPEALIFGNPIAQAASLADCSAASLPGGGPLNEIFWSAGCWGSMYPISGKIGRSQAPMAASLAASRGMYLISRLGFLKRTVGSDAMCGGADMKVLRKSQYRMQQLFPVPESNNADPGSNPPPPDINTADVGDPPTATEPTLDPAATQVPDINLGNVNGGCCHNFGENTMLWGEWRTRPATGQDFVYVLWRWTDCCAGVLGPGG